MKGDTVIIKRITVNIINNKIVLRDDNLRYWLDIKGHNKQA